MSKSFKVEYQNGFAVEIDDGKWGFKMRLWRHDRKTKWGNYQSHHFLDGMVAATEYYLPTNMSLQPIPVHQFMELTANVEDKSE